MNPHSDGSVMTRTVASHGDTGAADQAGADLLTLSQVAETTGRNAELLRRWCAAGRIRCQRMGRDWLVDRSELPVIEAMPRRGVHRRVDRPLDDLGILSLDLRSAVEQCLEPGESIQEILLGLDDSALIATDRRLFVVRDGVLVTEPERGRVAAWPLSWIRRVQITVGTTAGAVVLAPREAGDRAIVVVLGRRHLALAQAVVASLRARLAALGNFGADDPD
jgi:hypothetical protein